jgi:hypothetical protein
MLVDLNQISKEVRSDIGGDINEIRKIGSFMFTSTKATMEEGNWENIFLQYLGTFKAKPDRLFFLKDRGFNVGENGERLIEQYCRKK